MDCKERGYYSDIIGNPALIYSQSVTTLEQRLKAKVCELCGTTDSEHYEIYHVNKLKNLKGKSAWEIAMLIKRRNTLDPLSAWNIRPACTSLEAIAMLRVSIANRVSI